MCNKHRKQLEKMPNCLRMSSIPPSCDAVSSLAGTKQLWIKGREQQ